MIDFVTHLPWTPRRHEAVWVIVQRLTKSAHFLVVRITFTLEELCQLSIREIIYTIEVSSFRVLKIFPSIGTNVVKHFNTMGVHRSFPQGVVS